jgi:hypothetical protein
LRRYSEEQERFELELAAVKAREAAAAAAEEEGVKAAQHSDRARWGSARWNQVDP